MLWRIDRIGRYHTSWRDLTICHHPSQDRVEFRTSYLYRYRCESLHDDNRCHRHTAGSSVNSCTDKPGSCTMLWRIDRIARYHTSCSDVLIRHQRGEDKVLSRTSYLYRYRCESLHDDNRCHHHTAGSSVN